MTRWRPDNLDVGVQRGLTAGFWLEEAVTEIAVVNGSGNRMHRCLFRSCIQLQKGIEHKLAFEIDGGGINFADVVFRRMDHCENRRH